MVLTSPVLIETKFRKVLVDGRKTACFLKAFYLGARRLAETQLEAYKKITEADLGQHVRICRLHGVMHDEEGPLMGMLLTYVDQPRTMPSALWYDTPEPFRQRWASQVGETTA